MMHGFGTSDGIGWDGMAFISKESFAGRGLGSCFFLSFFFLPEIYIPALGTSKFGTPPFV